MKWNWIRDDRKMSSSKQNKFYSLEQWSVQRFKWNRDKNLTYTYISTLQTVWLNFSFVIQVSHQFLIYCAVICTLPNYPISVDSCPYCWINRERYVQIHWAYPSVEIRALMVRRKRDSERQWAWFPSGYRDQKATCRCSRETKFVRALAAP